MNNRLLNIIFLRSLRARIFVIVFITGLLPAFFLHYGVLETYEERAVNVRISDVSNQLKIIADHLITSRYLENSASEVIDAELNQLSNLYDGRVLIINKDLTVIKDTYGISQGKTIVSEEVIRCFRNESISNYDSENRYIEITTPIIENQVADPSGAIKDSEKKPDVLGVMLTSVSTDYVMVTKEIMNRQTTLFLGVLMTVLLVSSFVLAKFLDRPFERLGNAISEVKAGYTNEPIQVRDYRETASICDAFNELLGRMKTLDDSRQEFVSNVSHELKTPITSMKVLADSLLAQEDVPVAYYKEFMEDIVHEIDREDKIINDLLALVKMDKTVSNLNISQADMNLLTETVLKRLRPIAEKKDVELVFESIRQVTASVDEVKMALIISNLVENAIKYNKDHGYVKVTLDADHQFFMITVSDSGIGIPEESLEQIYERFYRVDKSHSREIGGTGLGLSITRNAILMHRGSIKVTSALGEGTTFLVKIPLTYISQSM